MLVKTLKLNNYRNYDNALFEFNPNLNIIIGKNGIGKTNILESLIVISNSKSFRTSIDNNLIKDGYDYARIEAIDEKGLYKVVINQDSKSLFYNNSLFKKTSDYIGKLNCILFKPSDLELFDQSPKTRRRLLDIELGKISKSYLTSLLKYNSLIKDKNKLLKEENIDKNYLSSINEMLVPEIEVIISGREKFFKYINNKISNLYKKISSEDKKILIEYKKCSKLDNIMETLNKANDKDCIYHYATVGTHLEDYDFYLNEKEINEVASQGQKRIVFIAFKLAIASYIKEITGYMPIILLDDVLSELDLENQNRLINLLPINTQVIITNTDLEKIRIDREYKLIDLEGGNYV